MAILEKSWSAAIKAAGCPAGLPAKGGPLTVFGTTDGALVALDGAGEVAWRTQVGESINAWPSADDVPGLGMSILVGTDEGEVVCLSRPMATIRWKTRLEGQVSTPSTTWPWCAGAIQSPW